jgi:hypothetical protein
LCWLFSRQCLPTTAPAGLELRFPVTRIRGMSHWHPAYMSI